MSVVNRQLNLGEVCKDDKMGFNTSGLFEVLGGTRVNGIEPFKLWYNG